jgi:hypothetical protein
MKRLPTVLEGTMLPPGRTYLAYLAFLSNYFPQDLPEQPSGAERARRRKLSGRVESNFLLIWSCRFCHAALKIQSLRPCAAPSLETSLRKDRFPMPRSIRLCVVLAAAALSTCGAWALNPGPQSEAIAATTTSKPVAHVYVGSGSHIVAFSSAANGKLTPVPGSPFSYSLSLMGANGHYLFGFEPSSVIIDSFSMAANGALKKAASLNTEKYNADTTCPLTYWNGQGLRIDHSGANLYNAAIPADFPCRTWYQSFRIDNANGELTFLGNAGDVFLGGPSINVLGNNQFVYSPGCQAAFGNGPSPQVTVFQRLSNEEGELVTAKAGVALPAAPINPSDGSAGYYCPLTMATDPTNHAAITLQAVDANDDDGATYGPVVIATFTADAKGNLTTTSTYKNMAVVEPGGGPTGSPGGAIRMSPSGKLLAIGGAGLELFHFNGGSPATKYKLLLTGDTIGSLLWDNANHLYALGSDTKGSGKLWVYTVTPTSVTEAPGSPYSITNAAGMVVQALN